MLKQYKLRNYHFQLVISILILNITGILIIGSAKHSVQKMQILGCIIGMVAMVIVSLMDYSFILRFTWLYYIPASSFRAKREIFVIYGQGLTHSPHVLRLSAFRIHTRGKAATRALSPSYQSTHSTFLPPSFGRRCLEGAEVGSRSAIFTCGDTNPASLRSSAPFQRKGRE